MEAHLKLNASQVKAAEPGSKAYKVRNGSWLYLLVQPNGSLLKVEVRR